MLGRATTRIALSVLGVGALGAGTVAMTGSGGGAPRCAAYTYPTIEACQVRHAGTTCRQSPQTTLWHPDRCGSSSGTRSGTTGGWWWWGGGGRRDTTTTTTLRSPTTTRPSTPSTPTVVGRSPSSGGRSGTTSSPSTSSRGGFGSTGRSSGG